MSKREAKSKATVSDSSEDEEEEVKPKKRKMEKSSKSKAKSSKNEEEEAGVFELSDKRRVSVREFKGKILIDIREFYNADGEMKPGKKGISLQLDQWEKLKNLISDIDEAIEEMK